MEIIFHENGKCANPFIGDLIREYVFEMGELGASEAQKTEISNLWSFENLENK